jgi:uncharacterized protein YecT (DUF1311 family)
MNFLKHFAGVVGATVALMIFLPTPSMSEQIPALCSKERNQAAMTRCADELLKKANADMGKTLKELLEATDKEDQKHVTEAQEAWKAYADKECISRIGGSPHRGGTIWPMMHLQCHVGLTRLRVKDLKEQVKCPGGRMDC